MKTYRVFLNAAMSLIVAGLLSCAGSNSNPAATDQVLAKAASESSMTDGETLVGRGHGGRHMRMMAELLELSDEQKAQMKTIIEDFRKSAKPEYGSFAGKSRDERREKRAQIREGLHEKMMAVLTPEQRAKAEELKSQFENGVVPEEIVDLHVARLSEKLNLTEEQQVQVRELGLKPGPHFRLMEPGKRAEHREQHRESMEDRHEQLMQILTSEQKALFEEMRDERRTKVKEHRTRFREGRTARRVEHLSEALNLDQEQKDKLAQIMQDARADALDAGSRPTREEMAAKRAVIHEQLKAILSVEQLELFENLEKKHSRRRGAD